MRRSLAAVLGLALVALGGPLLFREEDPAAQPVPVAAPATARRGLPADRACAAIAAASTSIAAASTGSIAAAPAERASDVDPVARRVHELVRTSELERAGALLHELDAAPGWVREHAELLLRTALDARAPLAARCLALDLLARTDELEGPRLEALHALGEAADLDPELRDAVRTLLARRADGAACDHD